MQKIPVTYRADPFDFAGVGRFAVEPGSSLLDIVKQVTDDPSYFIVRINGQLVEREWLARVRPKLSDTVPVIVTLHPVAHGGKTGNILAILATVALIVGVTAVSGGLLGPTSGAIGTGLLGSSFAAGGLGATAAAAALGVVGSLAISALTAPPIQPNAEAGGEPKTIAGVSFNSISPGDYLPMVLGKIRTSPPPLMPSYTTMEEGEVYVNGNVGLAGAYEIANLWINGSPIELFDDVEYSTRQGLATDTAPSLNYTYSVQEQQPRLKLSSAKIEPDTNSLVSATPISLSYSDWNIFNLHAPGDTGKFVIRFHWPTGMNVIGSGGGVNAGALPLRIEIKPRSSSVWYKLPELHFRQKEEHNSEIRQQVTLQWGTPSAGTLSISTTSTAWSAWWKSAPGTGNERTAESIYDPGGSVNTARRVTRDNDGFTIQIDNTAMDGDEEYDVRIRAGIPFKYVDFNASTTAAWTYNGSGTQGASFFNHYNTSDVVTKAGSAGAFIYVESIASFKVAAPFEYAGLANIAFKANGIQIDSISAEFTSIVPVWDGVTWANAAATQNPAALYRFVCLTTDYNSQALPGEVLDESTILEWFTECVTMDYECNAVIQNQSLPAVLQLIASAGWASPRYSDLWGVVMERSRRDEEIMQMLTPMNSRDLGTTKEFPKMPHAIRAEIFDENEEYGLRDDIVAYAPGFDVATAVVYESIRYDGITDPDKVLARAQFDINQLYLRSARYVRDVHKEGFLTPRGSLIGLADEVIEQTQRYSIIKTVQTSGGNVTGLTLETRVDLTEAYLDQSYIDPDVLTSGSVNALGVAIRLNDGSPSTHAINETDLTDVVTFVTPVSDTGQFEPSQIVALGIIGIEYRRMLVMGVEPHDGGELFRLILADERPELHAT